jgi:DNA-binding CsgD family transcriptional regulator
MEELLALTPSEAEVLTLVARGFANREIAAAPVISVKTASVHVSHSLHKLDVPTRVEAAAATHRTAPVATRSPSSRRGATPCRDKRARCARRGRRPGWTISERAVRARADDRNYR